MTLNTYCVRLFKLPVNRGYQAIKPMEAQIYQYLNFDQLDEYKNEQSSVPLETILNS